MKKLLIATALVLALPIAAWGASKYVTSFQDGTYEGKVTSVLPQLNGKPVKMVLKHTGDNVTATVTYEGGKEIWTWNDKVLHQKEIDTKTNAVIQQYGATATSAPTENRQTFNINCKNREKNECDAGVDYRNYWVLETSPNTVKYVVFGVPSDKKGDKTAKVEKRHEFLFNKIK